MKALLKVNLWFIFVYKVSADYCESAAVDELRDEQTAKQSGDETGAGRLDHRHSFQAYFSQHFSCNFATPTFTRNSKFSDLNIKK